MRFQALTKEYTTAINVIRKFFLAYDPTIQPALVLPIYQKTGASWRVQAWIFVIVAVMGGLTAAIVTVHVRNWPELRDLVYGKIFWRIFPFLVFIAWVGPSLWVHKLTLTDADNEVMRRFGNPGAR